MNDVLRVVFSHVPRAFLILSTRHAVFYATTSDEIFAAFKIDRGHSPMVFMVSEEADGMRQYSGEMLEMNLSEWILKHSAPRCAELSVSSQAGEIYATQFFSSRKLKFILFLSEADSQTSAGKKAIAQWKTLGDTFRKKALISYMIGNSVGDVMSFFDIDADSDIPLIAAHDPVNDAKYKSGLLHLSNDRLMQDFVAGVLSGVVPKVVKSEPVPKKSKSKVVHAVGSNLIDLVIQPEKDVLLEVYAPWCQHCKKLRATYDILAKAMEAEERIVIAKIDGTANDLPASWTIKGYPALLWFPAKDKPYSSKTSITPRPYWDAGHSLHELVSFVQKEGSFDKRTLKIATTEQLGTLLSDEESLRAKYEEEDRWTRRNEGRDVNDNVLVDYLIGEVVFDGKRWHIGAAALLVLLSIGSVLYGFIIQQKVGKQSKVKQG
jgi:protein disulfide isomerase